MLNNLPERGVFILSLDFELAWGSAHTGSLAQREQMFQNTRSSIEGLLKLLERFKISATWAVVGHLFLDRCQPVNGIKHPEIIRPEYTWFPQDWFAPDPCTQLENAPIWYARDVIQQILNCKVKQEIGCHTFSHVHVGDPGCSRECFASELRACRLAAEEFGVILKSFVFPRNIVGHLDVLREQEFMAYRGVNSGQLSRLPSIMRRVNGYLSPGATSMPECTLGLWNLPASLFYPPPHGWTSPALVAFQIWKAKRGLRRAAQDRSLFHLWFHPFNLASNPDRLLGGMEDIFAEFCHFRDKGLLDNFNMGELAQALQLHKEQEMKVL